MPRYLLTYEDSDRQFEGKTKSIVDAKNLSEAKKLALQSLGYSSKDFDDHEVSNWSALWDSLEDDVQPYYSLKKIGSKSSQATRELEAPVTVVAYKGDPMVPYKGLGPLDLKSTQCYYEPGTRLEKGYFGK